MCIWQAEWGWSSPQYLLIMAIVRRAARPRQFHITDHRVIEDPELSWEALGLLVYLLSRPDDWVINVRHLSRLGRGASRDKIYRILRELSGAGYAHERVIRQDDGRFASREWLITDEPSDCPDTAQPDSVGPDEDAPDRGDATVPNTDSDLNTDKKSSLSDDVLFEEIQNRIVERLLKGSIPKLEGYVATALRNSGLTASSSNIKHLTESVVRIHEQRLLDLEKSQRESREASERRIASAEARSRAESARLLGIADTKFNQSGEEL